MTTETLLRTVAELLEEAKAYKDADDWEKSMLYWEFKQSLAIEVTDSAEYERLLWEFCGRMDY